MNRRASMITTGLLVGLTACTPSLHLKVATDVPTPLIEPYPIAIGVYFTDELRNFTYRENSQNRTDWRIESGGAQVHLFRQILPVLFQSVREVDSLPAADVVAVFKPAIEAMQFALPQETKTNWYEVWIKYRMQLLDANGQTIASWPVTGYGKSFTRLFTTQRGRLNAAFNQALRDAGAKFTLTFETNKAIQRWLAQTEHYAPVGAR